MCCSPGRTRLTPHSRNSGRPFRPAVADSEDIARFAEVKLVTIDEFGGGKEAQRKSFADGGIFEQIYKPGR